MIDLALNSFTTWSSREECTAMFSPTNYVVPRIFRKLANQFSFRFDFCGVSFLNDLGVFWPGVKCNHSSLFVWQRSPIHHQISTAYFENA